MRRILPALVLSLALAGCAGMGGFGKSVFEGGLSVTATIQNPVTREQQAAVEASYNVAGSAALAYARLPRCKAGQVESLTNICSRWTVVQKLMNANRVAFTAIERLRDFMDNNQTVSAISAFNSATKALREFKAIAFINGINTEK